MRSITWPVHMGSPNTTRNNFWPRIAYSLYNFYGATMTIKGSLYWSIPMLKRFSVAKKSSQNRSPKWRFFGNLKVEIKNIVIGTPKRHFLTRNEVIWRILRKYSSRGVGCSLIEEPQKTNILGLYIYIIVTPKAGQNHVFGEQKPLNRSLQNFACRVPSWT